MQGVDFRIKKTSKGGYADYSTSQWSRKERSISEQEQASINAHGLFTLSDFLPKKPTDVELKVMKEMFEASVDGEAYDMDRWGQYFKPAGMSQNTGDPNKAYTPRVETAQAAATSSAPAEAVAEAAPAPKAEAATTGDSANRAQDILAMIRSRNQAQ